MALYITPLQVPDVRGLQVPGRHMHELLSCSNFAHECNTYVQRRGILDHGLVPKPFCFRQRTVLRAEEARPRVAT